MKDLYIIGAGGFGREVAWLVDRVNTIQPTWNLKGFIDDNKRLWGTEQYGYPVIGKVDELNKFEGEVYVVCAVGNAITRKGIVKNLGKYPNIKFATLIDPSVILSKNVCIGEGSIICAGTILTVDIKIGNHVIINLDCTLGHNAVIEDFVTIYPSVNISGNVMVGSYTELGTGMQIIQGKKIASHCFIGAGAVIVKDIIEAGTYVGIPAKRS